MKPNACCLLRFLTLPRISGHRANPGKRILLAALTFALPASLLPLNRDIPDTFAYEPAVASPLAPYLMRDGLKGPNLILALNEKNEVIQTSNLKYDERGRLLSEGFLDNRNNPTGEVRYVYEGSLPVREEYYNPAGILLSSKIRTYQQGLLIRISVEENSHTKFQRSYTYSKDRIAIKETADKSSDTFYITLDSHSRPLVMELADQEKKPLQKVEYAYDDLGRLKERTRTLPDSVSRCEYEYDQTGRLYQYSYYDRAGDKWKKGKTIRLVYSEKI